MMLVERLTSPPVDPLPPAKTAPKLPESADYIEPTEPIKPADHLPTPEEKEYNQHLQTIMAILNKHNVAAVLVGGHALRAIQGQPLYARRGNGSIPDLDFIALGPDEKTINAAAAAIAKVAKNQSNFPEVTLDPILFEKKLGSLFQFFSQIIKDNQMYYLLFRSVIQEVPTDIFEIHQRDYGGCQVPTFSGEWTYWRYFLRNGFKKPKDREKLDEFFAFLQEHPEELMKDESRKQVIEMIGGMSKTHPYVVRLLQLYWILDYKLNGRISASGGFLYKLIRLFR